MKIGDLVKFHSSVRRNGVAAGKLGLIVGLDKHSNPIVKFDGKISSFHCTQIERVISESR